MRGEVVFTFDGDAAGQKAALRAFTEDQRFVAQHVRRRRADRPRPVRPAPRARRRGGARARRPPGAAVRVRHPLASSPTYDLTTPEGRIAALHEAAPGRRPHQGRVAAPGVRQVAGRLARHGGPARRGGRPAGGRAAGRRPAARRRARRPPAPPDGERRDRRADVPTGRDPDDRALAVDREALKVCLQVPGSSSTTAGRAWGPEAFAHPSYAAVATAIVEAGDRPRARRSPTSWVESVREAATHELDPVAGHRARRRAAAQRRPAGRALRRRAGRPRARALVTKQVVELRSRAAADRPREPHRVQPRLRRAARPRAEAPRPARGRARRRSDAAFLRRRRDSLADAEVRRASASIAHAPYAAPARPVVGHRRGALPAAALGGGPPRWPGSRWSHAAWESPVLEVARRVVPGARAGSSLEEPGRVPEAVRERVTASRSSSPSASSWSARSGRRAGARISGRRRARRHRPALERRRSTRASTPTDPLLRAAADRELARMRAWYGP